MCVSEEREREEKNPGNSQTDSRRSTAGRGRIKTPPQLFLKYVSTLNKVV